MSVMSVEFATQILKHSPELKKLFTTLNEVDLKKRVDYLEEVAGKGYFIKRRLEMKPPHFFDVRRGGSYRPHEIDSFIELELIYDGISRSSLAHEAGDIIMKTGQLANKSLDPLGLAVGAIKPWKRNVNKEYKFFKRSIKKHFKKIDAQQMVYLH